MPWRKKARGRGWKGPRIDFRDQKVMFFCEKPGRGEKAKGAGGSARVGDDMKVGEGMDLAGAQREFDRSLGGDDLGDFVVGGVVG